MQKIKQTGTLYKRNNRKEFLQKYSMRNEKKTQANNINVRRKNSEISAIQLISQNINRSKLSTSPRNKATHGRAPFKGFHKRMTK